MKKFLIAGNSESVPFLVEEEALLGVKKIAEKVAADVECVSGKKPTILPSIEAMKKAASAKQFILFATAGQSQLLQDLSAKGLVELEKTQGKREVYGLKIVENPWEGIEQVLVIWGSDKRGTIYGMFQLSELMGVSPLHYWGDVTPSKKEEVLFTSEDELISKEPSVKYRGFFINDEWPCFGNWTFEHFGGFTAEMYDKVFELLLRLKGNYLWPAMWTSSFALDGPGLENAILADIYGVVIGNSHHEPCLRASEEWDKVRGKDSGYGEEWNYYTNKEGLLSYWQDGLKRSGKYENIITIGMRGECDSSMLGKDATLKENIDLLKDIIREQRKLIKEHVNDNVSEVPQLLALYKEVERYFYGDENTQGLKDWDELEDVILMLCEDNFGNMRTLPTAEMRNHKGGYGMYYHFDYHGDPISYEWVTSTPLTKIWEQMTMAYEYGIKDVWIVNVGDLKFNEFPLSYFMNLAYDFGKWGTSAPNKTKEFTEEWIKQQFTEAISKEVREKIAYVQDEYIRLNGLRRPEALNSHVYHPIHHREADRMIAKTEELRTSINDLYGILPDWARDAYYSMIYFPAAASINLLQMHLYAAKNAHYAKQGKPIANLYKDKVTEAIVFDRKIAEGFGSFLGGKWNGMQLAPHIGFTKWNEDNCKYPLRTEVEPAYRPRMVVSRADEERVAVKDYFAPMVITIEDFLYKSNTCVEIEVANDGIGSFTYEVIMEECEWLTYERETNEVVCQEILKVICIPGMLPKEKTCHKIQLKGSGAIIDIMVYGKAVDDTEAAAMTFFENNGSIVIEAKNYRSLKETKEGKLVVLEDFGQSGSGIKAYPVTKTFQPETGPGVEYLIHVEKETEYVMEVWMAPSNPMENGAGMRFTASVNGGKKQVIESIPDGFKAGVPHNEHWTIGVLENVRKTKTRQRFYKGENTIEIGMVDPGFVLERLVIYAEDTPLKESYLGPKESYFKK